MSSNISLTPFRRRVAGTCLVLGPVAWAVAEFTAPATGGNAAQQLAAIAQHREAALVGAFAGSLAVLLFIPGLFGLLQRTVTRGSGLLHVGLALSLYGLVTKAVFHGLDIMFVQMAAPGMNRPTMVALLDALEHNPAGAPLLAGHFAMAFGILILGAGLLRAHVGPAWAAVAVVLFPLADIVLGTAGLEEWVAEGISNALGIVGFASYGVLMLRGALWPNDDSEPVRSDEFNVLAAPTRNEN